MSNYCLCKTTTINMFDSNGLIAFNIDLKGNWCACLCGFGLFSFCKHDKVSVYLPTGIHIGTVEEESFCCAPSYEMRDSSDEFVMKIDGDAICCWFQDQKFYFKIYYNNMELGEIKKENYCIEICCPINSNYVLKVDSSLSPNLKALVLATIILIEMKLRFCSLTDAMCFICEKFIPCL